MSQNDRIGLLTLSLLLLAGCIFPQKVTFVDGSLVGRPTIRHVSADGNTIHVSVVQDTLGVWIAGVEAKVIAGEVYLSTINISSVVHATEFSVDLSGQDIPRDWKKHLYWIVGDAITSPVNPFVKHVREIRRAKIQL